MVRTVSSATVSNMSLYMEGLTVLHDSEFHSPHQHPHATIVNISRTQLISTD